MVISGKNLGLVNSVEIQPDPVPGTGYVLQLNDMSDLSEKAGFNVPRGGIPEGMWLTPRDELTPVPCIESNTP